MIIQHNILALNSHRQLGNNNSAVGKNLEKLSSGYRINRAGDDAAGLAISEKMRAQIKGLEVAKRNAQDGVSLVQTAEGALDEVHSMLKRMVELSTQSANGTYDDQSRAELQKEIKALNTEIDRIAEGTNFNDIKLLDGSLDRGGLPEITGLETIKPVVTAATSQKAEFTMTAVGNAGVAENDKFSTTIKYTDESGKSQTATIELKVVAGNDVETANGTKINLGSATPNAEKIAEVFAKAAMEDAKLSSVFNISNETDKLVFTSKKTGTASKAEVVGVINSFDANNKVQANGAVATKKVTSANDEKIEYDLNAFELDKVFTVNGQKFAFTNAAGVAANTLGEDVNIVSTTAVDAAAVRIMADVIESKTGVIVDDATTKLTFNADPDHGGLELQVGDTGEEFNRLTVAVGNMDAKNLGVNTVDISTITGAREAIDKIKAAINKVSSTRSDLGAIQNRLEHTISSLGVTAENMTASESRIRDVDMAREMMMFTQNNVLSQAAQAMLAQANQQPQQILQLLR